MKSVTFMRSCGTAPERTARSPSGSRRTTCAPSSTTLSRKPIVDWNDSCKRRAAMMLRDLTTSPDLVPGAHNAIHTCLRLRPEERITLITDRETLDIAAALAREVEELGAEQSVFVLEDYAPRPLAGM